MTINLESDHPVTAAAARTATGKTLDEWYSALDARGGTKIGRRAANEYLFRECGVDAWWATTISVEYEAARGLLEKDKRPKGYSICSTKTISAPLAEVYQAWVSNAKLSQWFGKSSEANVADGGSYANGDGDQGVYKRVRPNKDLRFTWENPAHSASIVDVVFQEKGAKTGVMVTHDRIQTRAEADGLRRGWGEALDRLKHMLEG